MGEIRIKTRVRELRKARELTLEQLAEKSGVSISQISHIERGTKGFSIESLTAIASALDTTVDKLFDMGGAWQEVPIIGVIKEGGTISKCERGKDKRRVKAPAVFGELVAIRVAGNSLYPRYHDGEAIFCTKDPRNPADCIGRECFVWLEGGEHLLRFVQEGARAKHFNLVSHNQPPLLDVTILYCHPVVHASRL